MPRRQRINLRAIVAMRPSDRKRRMRRLAVATAAEWKAVAREGLGSTRTEYIRAVQVTEVTESTAIVTLQAESSLPNILEQGMGPGGVGTWGHYDLRDFLLKTGTKSLKTNAQGKYYLHVPFGHSMKEIKAYGGNAAAKAARALDATRTRIGPVSATGARAGTQWGGRLDNPSGHAPNLRPNAQRVLTRQGTHVLLHPHATDPLAGLVRMEKTYAASTQSQYRTWRTISQSGKPWWSKGVRPRRFATRVVGRLGQIIADLA